MTKHPVLWGGLIGVGIVMATAPILKVMLWWWGLWFPFRP